MAKVRKCLIKIAKDPFNEEEKAIYVNYGESVDNKLQTYDAYIAVDKKVEVPAFVYYGSLKNGRYKDRVQVLKEYDVEE